MNLKTTRPVLEFSTVNKDLMNALSAAVFIREELWVASDELKTVERLTLRDGEIFSSHRSFELQGPLKLPAEGKKKPDGKKDVDQEIDIEGLAFDGQYLWLVGSHSIKRKKLDAEDRAEGAKENIKKLSRTEAEGNRFLLARVPIVQNEQGESVLVEVSPDKTLRAAQLPGTMTENSLTRAILEDDEGKADLHLAASLAIPGKDNGFDIEGLAVAGEKVFLGLRGPVLRGWAIILELHLEDDGASELRLKKIGSKGRAYRKHFLDLGGLGVRDLCVEGQDLLVLAGPTMNLDGPVRVFRWSGGTAKDKETVVFADELRNRALTIPHGEGKDHAEGMALIDGSNPPSILVVYDAPSEERRAGERALRADIFGLP